MILPSKSIGANAALITLGADVLELLDKSPKTVSATWASTRERYRDRSSAPLSFEWFVLALDLLFAIGAIYLTQSGLLELRR